MQRGFIKGLTVGRIARAALFLIVVALAVLPLSIVKAGESVADGGHVFSLTSAQPAQGEYVWLMGEPIGISIGADGLIVQGLSGVATEHGEAYPAEASGIQRGDILMEIDGQSAKTLYALKRVLEGIDGEASLTLSRKGKLISARITPVEDINGQKRLGLILKEDIGGVGTLTFVTKEGKFGALGHYIADGDTGLRFELDSGKIYPTYVDGVIKGEAGKAGGLQADVNRLFKPLGEIDENTLIGVYGKYYQTPDGEPTRVAAKGEAKMGAAQILTTIDGDTPRLYDIDVVKVISQSEADEKGMVIAVRDKRLLEATGGIVQGMSGSPIIQNGVFIGAVTHVFVQDPTRGYAVHSRFMYDEAVSLGASEIPVPRAA